MHGLTLMDVLHIWVQHQNALELYYLRIPCMLAGNPWYPQCIYASGAFSEEKGKRLIATIDHSLHGTRRTPAVASVDQAIAEPFVMDCPQDQTVGIDASQRSIAWQSRLEHRRRWGHFGPSNFGGRGPHRGLQRGWAAIASATVFLPPTATWTLVIGANSWGESAREETTAQTQGAGQSWALTVRDQVRSQVGGTLKCF